MDLSHVKEETLAIASNYKHEQRFILAILQDVQRKYNYLPKESLSIVAEYVGVELTKVYSVATFYKALSLKPKGENIIKVCDGTACHVKGSMNLIKELKDILGIEPGETSKDGKFSLETVGCVGACGLAPVAVINDEYHGNLTPASLREIIDQYRGGENHEK